MVSGLKGLGLTGYSAKEAGLEVQFSPEGYSRMGENFQFTFELIKAAVEGGATIINCPDTIGGASQLQGADYFVEHMKEHRRMIEAIFPDREICWSVHCHNDYGLAVQNTINAVFEGAATQIEGCMNGVGERAGNAALEQCIMIIDQFGKEPGQRGFCVHTDARLDRIQEVSDFIAEHMLRDAGAEVETAADGPEGIAKTKHRAVQSEPYDCIVTDIQMPLMDGYETTRRLRDLGYTGPVLALTANTMSENRDECFAAGCDSFLSKPIDRLQLVQTIVELIDERELP